MTYSNTDGRMRGRWLPNRERLKFLEDLKRESRQAATAAAKKIILARLKRDARRSLSAAGSVA